MKSISKIIILFLLINISITTSITSFINPVNAEECTQVDYAKLILKNNAIKALENYYDQYGNTINGDRQFQIIGKLEDKGYFCTRNGVQRRAIITNLVNNGYPEAVVIATSETGLTSKFFTPPSSSIDIHFMPETSKEGANSTMQALNKFMLQQAEAMNRLMGKYRPYWGHKERWDKSDLEIFYKYHPYLAKYKNKISWSEAEKKIITTHIAVMDKMSLYSEQMNLDLSNLPADIMVQIVFSVGGKALTLYGNAIREAALEPIVIADDWTMVKPVSNKNSPIFKIKLFEKKSNFGVKAKYTKTNVGYSTEFISSRFIGKVYFQNVNWTFKLSKIKPCLWHDINRTLTKSASRFFDNSTHPVFAKALAGQEKIAASQLEKVYINNAKKGDIGTYYPSRDLIELSDQAITGHWTTIAKNGEKFNEVLGHEMMHALSQKSAGAYYDITYYMTSPFNHGDSYIPLHEGATEWLYKVFLNEEIGIGVPFVKASYQQEVRVIDAIYNALVRGFGKNSNPEIANYAQYYAQEAITKCYFNEVTHLKALDKYIELPQGSFHDTVFSFITRNDFKGAINYINGFFK